MPQHDTIPQLTRRRRCLTILAAMTAGLFLLPTILSTASSAETAPLDSVVTIVHGLRGQLVDVSLDGKVVLSAFAPDRLTDPLPIASGQHRIELRPAGTGSETVARVDQMITVSPARRVSLVAHFAVDGSWTMTTYDNSAVAIPSDQAVVVFRNTAAVAPVDVRLDGQPSVQSLSNPDQAPRQLAPATYGVTVAGAGGGADLVTEQQVPVKAGNAMFLYLVGSGSNVIWLAQQESGGTAVLPINIQTGNSGLAAVSPAGRRSAVAGAVWGLACLAMVLALAGRSTQVGLAGAGAASIPSTTLLGQSADRPNVIPSTTALGSKSATLEVVRSDRDQDPVSLTVPRLSLSTNISSVATTTDGELAVPPSSEVVAWYSSGPAPGAPGSSVFAAHVDWNGRTGPFFELSMMAIGDDVSVTHADGSTTAFTVSEVQRVPKGQLPVAEIFRSDGPPTLRLVTCGGEFDATAHSYRDNVVVTAVPK